MATEYVRGIDDATARKAIDQFKIRAAGSDLISGSGVAYRLKDIRNYFENILPEIQERHLEKMGGSLPPGKDWGISYEWKYGESANGRTGLSFFVVPVLMDEAGTVLDYFSSDAYHHPTGNDQNYNVFDEGNLWP
ncbi:hypothetical protein [Flaviaesturariibacter terrae]